MFLLALMVTRAHAAAGPYTWGNMAIGGGGFVDGIVASPAQNGLFYARTDVGGAYRWNDAASTWVALTDMFPMSQGNYMGIESIAPDPGNANIVYAAGGMYESNGNGAILSSVDQGNTWTINPIATTMGGNDMARGMGERLAVDPNKPSVLYFGSRTGGLFKSTNSAGTWATVPSFPTAGGSYTFGWTVPSGLPIVVIDGQGGTAGTASSTIFVASGSTNAGSNLYRSNDAGATWALVAGGPSGFMAHHAGLSSDGYLWLAYSNDMGPWNFSGVTLAGQIWKYKVSTGVWTNVTPAANWGGMAGGLSVDAQNPLHVAISTLDWYAPDRILATADGGATWKVIGQPAVSYWSTGVSTYNNNGVNYWYPGGATTIGTGPTNWVEALVIDPFNSNRAMHGCGAGTWMSTNIQGGGTQGSGVIWNFNDVGLEEVVPQYTVPSTKGAFLGAIGDLGGMRNTSMTLYSATGEYATPIQTNVNSLDFAESNPNFVVRVGNSGAVASDVAYSNDNGVTWAPCAAAVPGYGTSNQMHSVAVAANGGTIVAAPWAGYGSPAYSTNNGASWTTCAGLPSGALVASDRVNSSLFYATNAGTLYVSSNGGATFTTAGTFTGNGAPRPVFGMTGEVWVAANGGPLYRFTGVGSTNTKAQIGTVTAAWGVGFGMAAPAQTHPATYIVGTVGGVYGFYRSDDGIGTAWTRINDSQHQYGWLQGNYIGGDEGIYGRCYLTSAGRGYIYGDINAVGSPTPTVPPSATPSRTLTPSFTAALTSTFTSTASPTSTPSRSPTPAVSPTGTFTAGSTSTFTPTATRSASPTGTFTLGSTATFTPTATRSASPSATLSASPTGTFTSGSTSTFTPTAIRSATSSASPTATLSASPTGTFTSGSTATSTPTATRSATPSASPTTTPSASPSATPTFTATSSATRSATPTVTITLSATRTSTMTSSPSPSATRTASPSPSDSPTASPSFTSVPPGSTETPTPTASPSFSASPTDSPSETLTDTETPTPSVSPSATRSTTSTPMNTATSTPVNTATSTPVNTATSTPVNTATSTPVNTATSTLVNTATSTPMNTATSTPVNTATSTPVAAATPTTLNTALPTLGGTSTATETPTVSATTGVSSTPTSTPTRTVPPSPSASATASPLVIFTATATPTAAGSPPVATPAGGTLSILDLEALPNPGAKEIRVLLDGDCDSLRLRIYSPALVRVLQVDSGPMQAGWNALALPEAWASMAPGLYFARATALRGSQSSLPSRPIRLLVLR